LAVAVALIVVAQRRMAGHDGAMLAAVADPRVATPGEIRSWPPRRGASAHSGGLGSVSAVPASAPYEGYSAHRRG
jgi:hypothetical protein